jgi:hypothetical protein
MLKPLGIAPQKVGPEDARVNGYIRAPFEEDFARYLAPEGGSQPDSRTDSDKMGTSDISKPDSHDTCYPVAKCEKPSNDGTLSGCPVAKGDSRRKAQARTTRSEKSDDLLYDGPIVEVPDLGPDPFDEHGAPVEAEPGASGGLSEDRRREFAAWRDKWIAEGEDPDELDDALRFDVREELDDPERVEAELAQIKALCRQQR